MRKLRTDSVKMANGTFRFTAFYYILLCQLSPHLARKATTQGVTNLSMTWKRVSWNFFLIFWDLLLPPIWRFERTLKKTKYFVPKNSRLLRKNLQKVQNGPTYPHSFWKIWKKFNPSFLAYFFHEITENKMQQKVHASLPPSQSWRIKKPKPVD